MKPDATRACDDGLAEWQAERAWIADANRLYGQRGYGIVTFDHSDYRRAGDVTPSDYVAEVTQDQNIADFWDDPDVGPDDYYDWGDFCEHEPHCSLGIPERLMRDADSNYGSAKADADRWFGKRRH